MEEKLGEIRQLLVDLHSKIDRLTTSLLKPEQSSFKGVTVRVMTESVEGGWWDYECIIEVPDRAPIRIGCTVSETAVEHAILGGIYAGLQQCWMHPASSKAMRIILEDQNIVNLLNNRKGLTKPPFESKKLCEKFFALTGLLEMVPSVAIELKS